MVEYFLQNETSHMAYSVAAACLIFCHLNRPIYIYNTDTKPACVFCFVVPSAISVRNCSHTYVHLCDETLAPRWS